MKSITIQNGNREVTISTGKKTAWSKDGIAREYIELTSSDKKRMPISSLYLVVDGGTADHTFATEDGRVYGYQYGGCCDSKTKRAAVDEAIANLV